MPTPSRIGENLESGSCAIPLFLPSVPKAGQRPRLQVFLSERENNSLLFIEMLARRRHSRQQTKTGLFQVLRHLRMLQVVVDFLVFLVKGFALADLFEAMLQGLNQQFFLRTRVSGAQRFRSERGRVG